MCGSGAEADTEAAAIGADHGLDLLKVIRMTGFMKGLYTDAEMKSDNVKVGRGAGGTPRPYSGCISFIC